MEKAIENSNVRRVATVHPFYRVSAIDHKDQNGRSLFIGRDDSRRTIRYVHWIIKLNTTVEISTIADPTINFYNVTVDC